MNLDRIERNHEQFPENGRNRLKLNLDRIESLSAMPDASIFVALKLNLDRIESNIGLIVFLSPDTVKIEP